jgi:ketosteroid isomerase-like protein
MPDPKGPLAADDRFFAALTLGDARLLDELLTSDFVFVDPKKGDEVTRTKMLQSVTTGAFRPERVDPSERLVRKRAGVAVVVGKVRIAGVASGTPFVLTDRYTHVFVEERGAWRLMHAQGTTIAATEPKPAHDREGAEGVASFGHS